MRSIRALLLLVGAVLLLAPAAASGQPYLTAFVGGNFGGDSGVSLDQSIDDMSRLSFGARLGAGVGIFGAEIDMGYTPDFYGKGTIFDASSVLTLTGNVVIGVPLGPVRPYVLGGLGVVRRTVDYASGVGQDNVTDSRAAYSIGGGVSFFFSEHVGLNADLRYFRNFSTGNSVLDLSNESFNFARGSLGVTFKF
ncbi:MAG: outer membrane beta-barrel protein [Vicinamibacterales bacterium]